MQRAPDLYQRLVTVMEGAGYTRHDTSLGFKGVPAETADLRFQVVPASAEPQARRLAAEAGTYAIQSSRKWSIKVLYRVADSVFDVVKDRVLPEEERITDLLLAMDVAKTVTATYVDGDDGGGFILLTLELDARYERPA